MALVLLVAAVGLLSLPGITHRLGRRLHPGEWARLCAGALGAGAVVLELAVALYAAPTVLRAAGVHALASACERLLGPLVPGGATAGWAAAATAVMIPILIGVSGARAQRSHRDVLVESWLGEHRPFGAYELVVLPTDKVMAVSIEGKRSQIVISQGLVDSITGEQLEAVLLHEAAHLDHHHQRFLLLAMVLERGFAFLPPVGRSVRALRGALERWADEAAVGEMPERRAVLQGALLSVIRALIAPPGLAAFTAADTVVERMDALDTVPQAPSRLRRALVYAPGLVLGLAIVIALGTSAADAQMIVAMAGRCRA